MKKLYLFIILLAPLFSFAKTIPFNPKTDCAKLKEPNTIVVFHASWCDDCQRYMPKYKNVSNMKKYAKWRFYDFGVSYKEGKEDWPKACGRDPNEIPTTYMGNKKCAGDMAESQLENFIATGICPYGDNYINLCKKKKK